VAQRALLACAVILLGYCAFALVDAWTFQRRETGSRPHAAGSGPASLSTPVAAANGLIGRMEIPRLGLSRSSSRELAEPLSAAESDTSRHGAAGEAATWAFRAPGHVFRPLKTEDQGRDSILDAERRFQVRG